MARPDRPQFLLAVSFALALGFDFLFWGKLWGLSFPVFIFFVLAAGFWLARRQRLKLARKSLWLLGPIAFFALVSIFRLEPFTLFLSRLLVFLLLAILVVSFVGGRWLEYGFSDFVVRLLGFVPSGLFLLKNTSAARISSRKKGFSLRVFAPAARGLLFALPVLWFLGALLASADPFFSRWLTSLFKFLSFKNASEYVFRGFYIFILTYILAASYLYAFVKSKKENLRGSKPLFPLFLGFGEAATMLASVNILFVAFVVIQFRYFFGGLANIVNNPAGLTFAEYARRGFAELVIVAVTSFLFFIALSTVCKRERRQQKWFSGSGIALFFLVSVILVSSFQRLLLYERVFGFTRMRTFPHVFMIWLGLLLLAVAVLEVMQRQRAFAVAILMAAIGFIATLPLLNVDAFIVRANIQRAESGQDFDFAYLATLSEDALPALVSAYWQSLKGENGALTESIAAALVCSATLHSDYAAQLPWQSWTWSRTEAARQLNVLHSETTIPDLSLHLENGSYYVRVGGQEFPCVSPSIWD